MRTIVLIVVGVVFAAPAVSAKQRKPAPLNWEDATVTAVRSTQVYEGERDTSTHNDVYYGRSRSSAVYAPSQIFTIQTAGLEFQIQWTGVANTEGMIDFVAATLLAGQPPNFSVGEHVQVAQSGQYLYVYTGGKKSKGYPVVSMRQVQAEARKEGVSEPKDTTNAQAPQPQFASSSTSLQREDVSVLRAADDGPGQGSPQTSHSDARSSLPATKAEVSIDSIPDGASIELNGKFIGQTPSKFFLEAGSTDLIIQKSGFVAWIGTIELISGASVTLRPELKSSTDGPPPPQPARSEKQQSAQTANSSAVQPRVLYKADPGYTEQARNARMEGKVVLQFMVDPTGQPREIRVLRGLGMGLDGKAVEALNKWKFQPGTRDGKAVSVQATVQVDFRLRDQ